MQTSKPTVALPSGRFSKESIAAVRSIIPIIPGVESTLAPMRAADVGQQRPLDDERRRSRSDPRARVPSIAHQTIPRPPETPSVSPVT